MRNIKNEYELIIKETISPAFKKIGFKKTGNNFRRDTDEIIQTINLQANGVSSDWAVFTLNFGLISEEIFKEVWKENLPKVPKEYHATAGVRLPFLKHAADKWYSLKNDVSLIQLSKEIEEDITQYGIPFFENHKSLASLTRLIEEENYVMIGTGGFQRVLLYIRAGMKEKANSYLNEMNTKIVKGYDQEVKLFAQKHQITLFTQSKEEE